MKKLKAFAHIYINSLARFSYYKELLKVPLRFSVKYFFALSFAAALIMSVSISRDSLPKVQKMANNILDEISAIYPENLVVTSKEGEWSINKMEPYSILMPKLNYEDEFALPEYLITFDHQGTLNDLGKKDTLVIVNEENVLVKDYNERIGVYPLESIPEGEFTKQDLENAINNVRGYFEFLPVMLFAAILFGITYYFMLIRLAYLFLAALLLLAAGVLFKGLKYGYKNYLKIAIHTYTLALTLEVIFEVLGIAKPMDLWVFGFNIIYGIVILYNFKVHKVYDLVETSKKGEEDESVPEEK